MTYQQQQPPSWAQQQWSPPQPPPYAQPPTTPPAHQSVPAVSPAALPPGHLTAGPWPVAGWHVPARRRPGTVPSLVAAAGFLGVVAGAFMPWASVFLLVVNGIQTEAGVLSMGFGLLGLLLVGLTHWRPAVFGVLGVFTAGVVVVMSAFYVVSVATSDEQSRVYGTTITPTVGTGLWLTLVAALIAGGGCAACALSSELTP